MNPTDKQAPEFVDAMLGQAVAEKASDMYWIPGESAMSVRFRVEGVQKDVASVPREYGERCVTRLKVMAGLLTYRTHVSQDGVVRGVKEHPGVEFRVSVMPTSHGERLSIRLLQGGVNPWRLDELGFSAETVASLRAMVRQTSGLIVLTGPTGCGKTTTIYSLIRELLHEKRDPAAIVTIEDPIECQVEGISQVSVSGTPEWGYADALRAALRQDVKVIVVGEMRDRDVVSVTLDAALTGHLVITTYHAGDVPSVYARILHQGFEPFLVASAVTGVVCQRLVQRKSGDGRVPVVAHLTPDDSWRDFITRNPGLTELRKKICEYPHADLQAVAERMAAEGIIGRIIDDQADNFSKTAQNKRQSSD